MKTIEKVKEIIVKEMNEENDLHSILYNSIVSRQPADMNYILEQISAIHKAKMRVLEVLLEKVKYL